MQLKLKKQHIAKLIDYQKKQQQQRQTKPSFLELLNEKELKKLDFNKQEYEYFIANCNFTDRELEILNLRRRGKSIVAISMETYMSERTIYRELKNIKRKIFKVI